MDDHDLNLLRTFRVDQIEPPAHLQAQIEDDLLEAILREGIERDAAPRGTRALPRPRRAWLSGLLRPALAGTAVTVLAVSVAVMSDGGSGTASSTNSGVQRASAGIFDATATALFGNATAPTPASELGSVDLGEASDEDRTLARGPMYDDDAGTLDQQTTAYVETASRNPGTLLGALRDAATQQVDDDPSDRFAFRIAMRWIIDPMVPSDLRAALLRSLSELDGIDPAITAVDMLGRGGIVLGHLDAATNVREQFLVNPTTGQLQEQRSFTTGYVDPVCPAGTFTAHGVYDDSGRPITAADAPWLDWPAVVEPCDITLAAL